MPKLAFALVILGVISSAPDVVAINCDTVPARPVVQLDSIHTFDFQVSGSANGCCGWIAPDGEEYAIVCSGDGVEFIQVNTLSWVAHAPMQVCFFREAETYRNYCYVVSDCTWEPNAGLMIVDMQYLPDSVHVVGTYTGVGNHFINLSIDTATGFAYITNMGRTGFRIVDLSVPESPTDAGTVLTSDIEDLVAFNDTVYVAEGADAAFSIWDCTVKQNPIELAHVTVPGVDNNVRSIWPTPDRKYLATTENEPTFRTMKLWNTSSLANIYVVSEYVGPGGIPHRPRIEGDYIYLSHFNSGVRILDISVPECIQEVASFDTHPVSNEPNYDGCWDVYPHTAGRQSVYATNSNGNFYILRTDVIATEFGATPVVGNAPLAVDFTDLSPISNGWIWQFGDGDSALTQNPSHVYEPGLFSVGLAISTPFGTGTEFEPNFITALAETLKVSDRGVEPGEQLTWDIMYANHVPITEFKLPIQLSNVPSVAVLDSISTFGCRTSYFESQQFAIQQYGSGKAVLNLKADNGGGAPALSPGNGPIARIYLTVSGSADIGQQIVLTMPPLGVSQHSLQATTYTTAYVPELNGATATVSGPCNCQCHGDPVCDGFLDVLDVIHTVSVSFRNFAATIDPTCPHSGRTDLDCSGTTDVLDVVKMVLVAFRNGDPQTVVCNPCTP